MESVWQYYRGKWRRLPELNPFQDVERKKLKKIQNAIFQHGGENFTLRDFYDAYKDDLPQIVIATQGYDGCMELDTIGMGQVMRIHSVCKQRRLIARDSSGRNITIPLIYPLPFRVCTTKNKRILESHTILIPLCLQNVLVSIVTGIQDMTQEHFHQFLRDIEIAAKAIVFDEKTGIENIALYKQVDVDTTQGDNIYETLEPDRFFRFAKSQEEYLSSSNVSHFHGENKSREITLSTENEIDPAPLLPNSIYRKKPPKPPAEPPDNERCTDDIPPPLPPRNSVLSRERTSSTSDGRTSGCDYVIRGNEDYTGGRKDDYVTESNSADYVIRGTSDGYVTENSKECDVKINSKEDYVISNSEDNYVTGKAVFKKTTEDKGGDKNLTDLTIAEISEVMKALRMQRHIDTFKEEGVDGFLLADFNENILKEEFKFTATETVKMMKFIRTGHIPH